MCWRLTAEPHVVENEVAGIGFKLSIPSAEIIGNKIEEAVVNVIEGSTGTNDYVPEHSLKPIRWISDAEA